ncbi:MAG: carotenoid 1,2-hydratase [Rhodoferax sp.]|nr:carotenoid 1,2-hydratase [Rhodoferax sp.]
MIAFVGSVFSPYYAWARARGVADPENHCALNVALYGRSARRWAMTERGARHCARQADRLVIGPSHLRWDGATLTADVDERCVPVPRRIRGRIRLTPDRLFPYSTAIDTRGVHRWGPIAPSARISVQLSEPGLNWTGSAYLDSNEGDEPVDRAFTQWDWSRSQLAQGDTAVLYDLQYPNGSERVLALRFMSNGSVEPFEPPPRTELPRTAWWLTRRMRSSSPVSVIDQLEDTPFYQRAIVGSELLGQRATSFHESLSVPRLVSPVVRAMLPWRMPRRS